MNNIVYIIIKYEVVLFLFTLYIYMMKKIYIYYIYIKNDL